MFVGEGWHLVRCLSLSLPQSFAAQVFQEPPDATHRCISPLTPLSRYAFGPRRQILSRQGETAREALPWQVPEPPSRLC